MAIKRELTLKSIRELIALYSAQIGVSIAMGVSRSIRIMERKNLSILDQEVLKEFVIGMISFFIFYIAVMSVWSGIKKIYKGKPN